MISRKNRFHGRASIQRLYKNSKMVRSATLSLRYAPNPKRTEYRLAVVVSRKVSKSAVVRNRIRRRVYEDVRILSTSFSVPFDLMVVVFDEGLADKPAAYVEQELTRLLKKAKILTPESPVRGPSGDRSPSTRELEK